MKIVPYKKHRTEAVAIKHDVRIGGMRSLIMIYAFVGVSRGELVAVRYRYEGLDYMSRMHTAKIYWAIPERNAADGARPVEPIPYFNTSDSGRVYLDEVEMCSPGWGAAWGVEYCK